MGQPKLVLPWRSTTILGQILETCLSVGMAQIAVVCAPPPHAVSTELDRLRIPAAHRIVNPQPAAGMFSSIQCAARWPNWEAGLTHFMILLGDQPQISRDTLLSLMRHAENNPGKLIQPAIGGKAKHPILLPTARFIQLGSTPHLTLRDFLLNRGPDRSFLEVNDPSVAVDLDSPADYAAALARFGSNEGRDL